MCSRLLSPYLVCSCPRFLWLWVNYCPAVFVSLSMIILCIYCPVCSAWFHLVYLCVLSTLPCLVLPCLALPCLESLKTVIWVISSFLPHVCTVTEDQTKTVSGALNLVLLCFLHKKKKKSFNLFLFVCPAAHTSPPFMDHKKYLIFTE